MARGSCPACGLPAEDGPFTVPGFFRRSTIPWNMMVRARTHRGRAVYVCDRCETALEETRLGYRASPAAQIALRDSTGAIIEFGCDWQPGDQSYGGLYPVMEEDGQIRLRDLPGGDLRAAKAHMVAAAYVVGNERTRSAIRENLATFLTITEDP